VNRASCNADNEPNAVAVLQCPECFSNSAIFLNSRPPRARCADCDCTYKIKTVDPLPTELEPAQEEQSKRRPGGHQRKRDGLPPVTPVPPPEPSDIGPLTEYVTATIKGGPEALRAAQKEANRLAKRFGFEFQSEWLLETKWLKEWASGAFGTRTNGVPSTSGARILGDRVSRVRVRVTMAWRARWLAVYAMSGSKFHAARRAHVGVSTVDYHVKNDPDFAAQTEAAKAHAIDLLFTRCMQRCLEGDVEPIYWQGIVVGHVRKFDSRLQIEMLRALMPQIFKTPGIAPVNVNTGEKMLVLDEPTRMKLIEARRRALEAMPERKALPAE